MWLYSGKIRKLSIVVTLAGLAILPSLWSPAFGQQTGSQSDEPPIPSNPNPPTTNAATQPLQPSEIEEQQIEQQQPQQTQPPGG
jgi:hypothetical protein